MQFCNQVFIKEQSNNFGIVFHLFCPANPTIFDEPMIMFYNKSMKNNLNFKTICPLKQKEQTTRITRSKKFRHGIELYLGSRELQMEEYRWRSIKIALLHVGEYSQICHHWEIYKLLFLMHNIHPVWINGGSLKDIRNV